MSRRIPDQVSSLLLKLCRHDFSTADLSILADSRNVDDLLTLAGHHQVLGLVLRHCEQHPGFGQISAIKQPEMLELLKKLRQQMALFDLEASRVCEVLEAAGISAIRLKGAALPKETFPDPVMRYRHDLDLCIEREALHDAQAELHTLGYEPHENIQFYLNKHFHLPFYHPTGYVVELHWDLQEPTAAFGLSVSRLRAGALQGRTALADLYWHLLQQITQEDFTRLSRLIDLDRLIRSADATTLKQLKDSSGTFGLNAVAYEVDALCRSWFDTPPLNLPESWLGPAFQQKLRARFNISSLMLFRKLRQRPTASCCFLLTLLQESNLRSRLIHSYKETGVPMPWWKRFIFYGLLWIRPLPPPDGILPPEY